MENGTETGGCMVVYRPQGVGSRDLPRALVYVESQAPLRSALGPKLSAREGRSRI